MEDQSLSTLACPRCSGPLTDEEFYGMCKTCQSDLRTLYSGDSRDVVADAYEPKMNVTPNAVASKDD